MNTEDVTHLGTLARIPLSDADTAAFAAELGTIVEYVSAINEITADVAVTKQNGPVMNVFRPDEVTNESGACRDVLLEAMPDTTPAGHLKVPRILSNDE